MIRRWLSHLFMPELRGIETRLSAIQTELALSQDNIRHELLLLRNELAVTMGDEHDPKRKALSDQLGARMRQRLLGEENARRQMEGKEPLKELPR